MNEPQAPAGRGLVNAPLVVSATSLLLIGLHALVMLAGPEEQLRIAYDFALAPRRFHAGAGSDIAYPSDAHAWLTLVSCALLHGDWMHVIVNALMILAFGAPVARVLGTSVTGAALWMLLFTASIASGSLAYLALTPEDAGAAVGASGGASGLIAAAFLLTDPGGPSLLSRRFLSLSLGLVVANVLLTLLSPFLLGVAIAWEAHAGGYAAGAVMALLLSGRRYRR